MRILYLYKESPLTPAGGAGTYLSYMAEAMAKAGHEIFLFSWSVNDPIILPDDTYPFKPGNVHFETISEAKLWARLPHLSWDMAVSRRIRHQVLTLIDSWDIDVVEATDFLSPAYALYQTMQSTARWQDRLCVTYHHGFLEDIYEAGQMRVTHNAQINQLGERQQCRGSDVVIAPSTAAFNRLQSYGISGNVELKREPYKFEHRSTFREPTGNLTYMGRVSIQKGIDQTIYLCNIIDDIFPLKQLRFIGNVAHTPFRVNDMKDYVLRRLKPDLRPRFTMNGAMPREQAISALSPGDIAPHLGKYETFSYSCIEAIDRGTIPIIRQGTAMEEFLPEHLRDLSIELSRSSVEDVRSKFLEIVEKSPSALPEIQEYCATELEPGKIAEDMGDLYDARLRAKRGTRTQPAAAVEANLARHDDAPDGQITPHGTTDRPAATVADVTVLIPAYKPTAEFMETVDSLSQQSVQGFKVLICDDGTPDGEGAWFEYARSILNDVEIFRQPNTGLLGARNALISRSNSRLSIFLDADDLLDHAAIEGLLEAYNVHPRSPRAVFPLRRNFASDGEIFLQFMHGDHLHFVENDFRMTALIETAVLRQIGFDAMRRNGEGDDWVFWLEFFTRGHVAVTTGEMDFLYRFHHGSMSWPWSDGQAAGTHAMIMSARLDDADSVLDHLSARGVYAKAVRR